MAEGLNKVLLLGNLGRTPNFASPGRERGAQAPLGHHGVLLDKSNNRQERTEWHQITVGQAVRRWRRS